MNADEKNRIFIEVNGLEVFAHHGLLPGEREHGQIFRFDIRLKLIQCPACESDDITGTADYAPIIDRVVAMTTENTYQLLERLVSVVADDILERNPFVESVRIRVAKTAPPLPHALDNVAVMLRRKRPGS
ncbi:MAG: dihydroneopterin aldolase [Thermoleophilia bacterium]